MSAFTIPSIFTAVDKFSAPVQRMTRNLSTFTQRAEVGVARLDRRVRRLTPSFGGLKNQILGFASAAVLITGINSSIETISSYEQANADLAAVMNTTSANSKLLEKDSIRLGSITAKSATEVVGLQEAYARLGFETSQILNLTESTINGSIALNGELAETAELTGAMVRTFDAFSSLDAPQILDQMTLSTQKSALNFEKLQTTLPIVAGAANAAGIPFTKLLALLGKLSDAGIDASSSATALKNIFIRSREKGLNYVQILGEIQKNQDKLTASTDAFGFRASVSGTILANNLETTEELTKVLELASKGQENAGAASKAAAERLDTFKGSVTLFKSAWEGFLIRLNDGTGGLSIFRTIVELTTRNLETIVKVVLGAAAAWVALKTIILVTRGALLVYNIALGISSALSATAAVAVGANTAALAAYNITTKAVTAAQWLFNAALTANPIGAIIAAVVAMIAVLTAVIVKYEEWGAAISLALGPIGILINLIMSFKRNWLDIVNAFKFDGFVSGIKQIGVAIVDSLLFPVQQLLNLLSEIPGIEIAAKGANFIEDLRRSIGTVPDEGANTAEVINTKERERDALTKSIIESGGKKGVLDINVNDPNQRTTIDDGGLFPGINLTSTMAFQ